jgi:hypothetical protein
MQVIRNHWTRLFVLGLALVAAPGVALALADYDGTPGRIAELEVLNGHADRYLQYHGRILITFGERSEQYRWGGSSCSNRTISESMVLLLQRAQDQGATIVPRYFAGQGGNRCLGGFTQTFP